MSFIYFIVCIVIFWTLRKRKWSFGDAFMDATLWPISLLDIIINWILEHKGSDG